MERWQLEALEKMFTGLEICMESCTVLLVSQLRGTPYDSAHLMYQDARKSVVLSRHQENTTLRRP